MSWIRNWGCIICHVPLNPCASPIPSIPSILSLPLIRIAQQGFIVGGLCFQAISHFSSTFFVISLFELLFFSLSDCLIPSKNFYHKTCTLLFQTQFTSCKFHNPFSLSFFRVDFFRNKKLKKSNFSLCDSSALNSLTIADAFSFFLFFNFFFLEAQSFFSGHFWLFERKKCFRVSKNLKRVSQGAETKVIELSVFELGITRRLFTYFWSRELIKMNFLARYLCTWAQILHGREKWHFWWKLNTLIKTGAFPAFILKFSILSFHIVNYDWESLDIWSTKALLNDPQTRYNQV